MDNRSCSSMSLCKLATKHRILARNQKEKVRTAPPKDSKSTHRPLSKMHGSSPCPSSQRAAGPSWSCSCSAQVSPSPLIGYCQDISAWCKATYVKHKHKEVGFLPLPTQLLLGVVHILLQLAHCIFQRRPGVIDLVDNQDVLANQVVHLQRAQVQPLRARDLGPRHFFGVAAAQVFVQRETNRLDGDVGLPRTFQERSIGDISVIFLSLLPCIACLVCTISWTYLRIRAGT